MQNLLLQLRQKLIRKYHLMKPSHVKRQHASNPSSRKYQLG